jgi:hypothetical protein
MDVNSTRTPKATRPQTILQTLERTLGGDLHLLRHLPKDTVVGVGPSDALEDHVASKIEFGTTQDGGNRVTVYAYMSTSSRQRNLPEVHLRGRQPGGAWKPFRIEELISQGEIHVAFERVKHITTAAMKALLQVDTIQAEINSCD